MSLAVIMLVSADKVTEPKTQAVLNILEAQGWAIYREVEPFWTGFTAKLRWAHKCARELVEYTHLMLVDARDVVVLGTPDEIMARFLEFDHPWICAAEPNIWPQGMYEPDDYPTCEGPYRYLNSGVYLAEREHLLDCFERWPAGGVTHRLLVTRGEDGPWLTENYLGEPGAIKLDHACSLFQCCCGSLVQPDPICVIAPGKVHNRVTGTDPLVIHFNGGDDITMPERKLLWAHLI